MVNPRPVSHNHGPRDGRFDHTDNLGLHALLIDPVGGLDIAFPDDYIDAFAEGLLGILSSRFRVPSHAIAIKRGWSTLVGNSASHRVPRGGAPWTDQEDRDLLVAAAGKINLSKLAEVHGRTEHAIATRLERLGVDRGTIVASDFDPVTPEPPKVKPRAAATSPESRLRTLLTIAMGFSSPEHAKALPPADITFLVVDDLISFDPTGKQPPALTDRGHQVVDSVVGRSTGRKKAVVTWNQARQTSELEEGCFFLVTSGDVYKEGGAHGRPSLKNPPRVVQSSGATAEKEALRLARENPGAKFYVLQAVSVHEVPPPQPVPAYSRRV